MAGTATIDTGAPVVTLRTAPMTPFDGAIAAARTCYSPRVIGTNEVTPGQRDTIGALSVGVEYHVAVEAFDENGVSTLGKIVSVN